MNCIPSTRATISAGIAALARGRASGDPHTPGAGPGLARQIEIARVVASAIAVLQASVLGCVTEVAVTAAIPARGMGIRGIAEGRARTYAERARRSGRAEAAGSTVGVNAAIASLEARVRRAVRGRSPTRAGLAGRAIRVAKTGVVLAHPGAIQMPGRETTPICTRRAVGILGAQARKTR